MRAPIKLETLPHATEQLRWEFVDMSDTGGMVIRWDTVNSQRAVHGRQLRCRLEAMSLFRVNVVARNPKDESRETPPIDAVVDSGSELSWLPADALRQAGIMPRRKRTFMTATRQTVTRDVGYAILASEGFETADEVVFGEASDLVLLGVRTIEGFGVRVDHVGHRFVAQTSIVA